MRVTHAIAPALEEDRAVQFFSIAELGLFRPRITLRGLGGQVKPLAAHRARMRLAPRGRVLVIAVLVMEGEVEQVGRVYLVRLLGGLIRRMLSHGS